MSIGIPTDDGPDDRPIAAGWEVPVSGYFKSRAWHALPTLYAYDFGDDWEHVLVHECMQPAKGSLKYPWCLAGARRCPPEDCGGVHGYAEFLETLADPEHASMRQWSGGHYDPDAFDPKRVVFDDSRKRWKVAFQ